MKQEVSLIIIIVVVVLGIVYMVKSIDTLIDERKKILKTAQQQEVVEKETYKTLYNDIVEILKVRDCEYVLWHNGYGSDMEHYADCKNPNHE